MSIAGYKTILRGMGKLMLADGADSGELDDRDGWSTFDWRT